MVSQRASRHYGRPRSRASERDQERVERERKWEQTERIDR